MSRQIARSLDGVGIEEYRARYTGTIVLEDEEASASALDELTVEVTVSRVKDVQVKVDKGGNVARIAVRQVVESRLLEGDLRDLLVERLNLLSADPEPVLITPGQRTPAQRSAAQDDPATEYEVDEETGEVVSEVVKETIDGVIGHIKDHAAPTPPSAMSNVKPFNPDAFEGDPRNAGPGETEVVGHIGSRDSTLSKFLQEV